MSVAGENTVDDVYPNSQDDSHSMSASVTKTQKTLGNNGSLDLPRKIENFKSWSSTAMKCTKQVIEEKLGTTSPTRDPEIEARVDEIRQMQVKYQEMSTVVKKIISHMYAITALEQTLSSQLTIAAQHQPELSDEFARNAEIRRTFSLSLNDYIGALELFSNGLETFCKKAIPDTLETIRQLEHARLVYDAYRNDLARVESKASGRTDSVTPTTPNIPTQTSGSESVVTKAEGFSVPSELNAHQKFAVSKEAYLALKKDTDVKMKLLHENRTRVIRKHLNAIQAATLSYHANGFIALKESLKALTEQHNVPSESRNQNESSFLEAESPSPFAKQPSAQQQQQQQQRQYPQKQQQKPIYFTPTESGLEVNEEGVERDVFQD